MKITKERLRLLIREMALKSIHFATPGEKGYDFQELPPDDAEALYSKTIAKELQDIKIVKDFFKNSIIDVNLIVLPDTIYSDTATIITKIFGIRPSELFHTNVDSGFFGKKILYAKNYALGKVQELEAVRSKIDPDAYNMIIQRQDQDEASAFLFDLSWITHDLIGHAVNFNQQEHLLVQMIDAVAGLLSSARLTNPATRINQLTQGGSFDTVDVRINTDKLSEKELDNDLLQDLVDECNQKGFNTGILPHDLAASIFGYYFIHRKLPDAILSRIESGELDGDRIQKHLEDLNSQIIGLKGKVGYFNFGDEV